MLEVKAVEALYGEAHVLHGASLQVRDREVVALLGPGIGVKSGEHAGYAGLVDLKNGDLVWLNADGAMGGDVRNDEGASKRVRELLEDFPGSAKPAAKP